MFTSLFYNNDPYQYIICYRIILESKDVNIEDWINLVFGEYSYGKKAQDKGNLFMAYYYKWFIESSLKLNKNDKKLFSRLNMLGINLHKIYDKVYYKNIKFINFKDDVKYSSK